MLNRCKSISPKNIKSQQSAERNANQLKKFKKKVTEQSEPQNAQRFQPQPTAQRSKILPENPIILGQAAPEQHENKGTPGRPPSRVPSHSRTRSLGHLRR